MIEEFDRNLLQLLLEGLTHPLTGADAIVDLDRVKEIRLSILEIVATATNLEIETATKTLDIAFKS